jgi:hypothetical protein
VGANEELAFVDRGEHRLKGIGQPQRVFALVEVDQAAAR